MMLKLIRKTIGTDMGVKASGGIRNLKTTLEMIDAGASKIGTSTGPAIMNELLKNIIEIKYFGIILIGRDFYGYRNRNYWKRKSKCHSR